METGCVTGLEVQKGMLGGHLSLRQQSKKSLCSCSRSSGLPVLTREVLACPEHIQLCFTAQLEVLQPTWLQVRVQGRAGCRKLAAPGPAPLGPIPLPVPRAHLTPTDGIRLPAEFSRGQALQKHASVMMEE